MLIFMSSIKLSLSRRLGALVFTSKQPGTYDGWDRRFLQLVATQVDEIIRDVGALEAAPAERFEQYLLRVWSLQFDEPAANDVLLRVSPDSEVLIALCDRARTFALELLEGAQSSGRIRRDLTEDDLHGVIWERGVIVRQTDSSRAEYLRRCEFVLRGLRAHEDER